MRGVNGVLGNSTKIGLQGSRVNTIASFTQSASLFVSSEDRLCLQVSYHSSNPLINFLLLLLLNLKVALRFKRDIGLLEKLPVF